MALQSAFKERLGDMEITRNQRLSLLQDEKELQRKKSLLLSGKHAKIRSLEQNCLMLDHKLASDNFKISSLKSLIEFLDRKYQTSVQQLSVWNSRDLKVEIEELVQLEKERDKFYSLNCSEMNEFKKKVDKSAEEIGCKVKDLRSAKDKLIQESNSLGKNHEIQAAETRKSELIALKKEVECSLESNKRQKLLLQEQLQSLR
ncbi:uncharacterized protein LOC130814474 isoform X3 [Amaranthus tricolor]|uniref:uncharacterized protein LOC130814474 isoform X3 n=1 Tax=Amaranthus tricolor TaxID=29722 RepID=UPI00258711D5|nr:uncharacterized protein LOC130814474 isoform X3 [Amaranthus tricolor]XP_057536535.1 uncharacterized protein LOC130814474 isoform X3 [Amaranthus tricolor]